MEYKRSPSLFCCGCRTDLRSDSECNQRRYMKSDLDWKSLGFHSVRLNERICLSHTGHSLLALSIRLADRLLLRTAIPLIVQSSCLAPVQTFHPKSLNIAHPQPQWKRTPLLAYDLLSNRWCRKAENKTFRYGLSWRKDQQSWLCFQQSQLSSNF
jgi:hypothetical protein